MGGKLRVERDFQPDRERETRALMVVLSGNKVGTSCLTCERPEDSHDRVDIPSQEP
jgi:hypothetical protein